ncbi:MAG: hypothetical protein ABW076_13185 [Candidatus Thiodiazotropha sp.]
MQTWPAEVASILEDLGFLGIGNHTYAARLNDIYALLMLDGALGNSLELFAAAWTPGLRDRDAESPPIALHSLPVSDRVSLNSVGSDAGQTYWTKSEFIESNTASAQLIELIHEVALPWFHALKDREGLAQILKEHETSGQLTIDPSPSQPHLEFAQRLAMHELRGNVHFRCYSSSSYAQGPGRLLAQFMESAGFSADITNGTRFYRYRADANLYDVILPRLIAYGARIIFDLFTWVPEFILAHQIEALPEDLININGGVLCQSGIDFYPYLTHRCSIPFDEHWLDQVSLRIREHALPWFETIHDRQTLIESVREDFRPLLDQSLMGNTTLREMLLGQI